jgi:hypothetical protein
MHRDILDWTVKRLAPGPRRCILSRRRYATSTVLGNTNTVAPRRWLPTAAAAANNLRRITTRVGAASATRSTALRRTAESIVSYFVWVSKQRRKQLFGNFFEQLTQRRFRSARFALFARFQICGVDSRSPFFSKHTVNAKGTRGENALHKLQSTVHTWWCNRILLATQRFRRRASFSTFIHLYDSRGSRRRAAALVKELINSITGAHVACCCWGCMLFETNEVRYFPCMKRIEKIYLCSFI